MLKVSKKKLGNKARLKLGDVENLPFDNNTFDYVHVKDALPSIQIRDAIRKSSELNQEIKLEVWQ